MVRRIRRLLFVVGLWLVGRFDESKPMSGKATWQCVHAAQCCSYCEACPDCEMAVTRFIAQEVG